MATTALVRARIDENLKNEAAAVLADMGLLCIYSFEQIHIHPVLEGLACLGFFFKKQRRILRYVSWAGKLERPCQGDFSRSTPDLAGGC